MKNQTKILLFSIFLLVLFPSCVKQSSTSKEKKTESAFDLKPFEKTLLEEEKILKKLKKEDQKLLEQGKKNFEKKQTIEKPKQEKPPKTKPVEKIISKDNQELDFTVKNITGKTIYVTCFSYIKKRVFYRWRWDKSPVYKLKNNESVIIDIDYIPDEENRKNVYGYLAVFDTEKEAKKSSYELLDDKNKIDLDLLYKLKDQQVLVGIEKYGFKGDLLDYDFVPLKNGDEKYPELDFVVQNETGKALYITCFVYQLKEDQTFWRYDKTPLIKLENNGYGLIDIDTISKAYDRVYMRGYLGVFDEKNKQEAEKVTYELLKPENKVSLGRIAALKNKKIVLEVEKYGETEDKIDFTVKPIQRIDFKKALKLK